MVQLPSFDELDTLERDVHLVGKSGTTANPESGPLLSAAANLTGAQADLNAVARRQLPAVVLWLLLFTATLSAAVMGIVAVKVRRPYLILAGPSSQLPASAWCSVCTTLRRDGVRGLSAVGRCRRSDRRQHQIGASLSPASIQATEESALGAFVECHQSHLGRVRFGQTFLQRRNRDL